MKLSMPTLLGIESITADELKWRGFQSVTTENGRVFFEGDFKDAARANLWIRTGERVQIVLGAFDAFSFEDLFQGVLSIPWEAYIGKEDAFPVKGFSLKSVLHSVPDCQKIIKKAIVSRLDKIYHLSWFPETGATMQVQFSIMKDHVLIMLDTSGVPLHKRGYRKDANGAPIRETLAAAMVDLARVHRDSVLCDPFCGSGTIVIEGAMKAKNIAPGLFRHFLFETWQGGAYAGILKEEKEKAVSEIKKDAPFEAYAYDIDPACVLLTQANARKAHVGNSIHAGQRDIRDFRPDASRQITVCNPPYGDRMLEVKEAEELYRVMGTVFEKHPGQTYAVISPHERFETLFGRRSDKKRKLYNGMIQCYDYMYFRTK